jgi:enoyl-CoA hydratase
LSINQILKDRVNMMLEASMALEQVTFATDDHKEATLSFKEKRKPKFGKA